MAQDGLDAEGPAREAVMTLTQEEIDQIYQWAWHYWYPDCGDLPDWYPDCGDLPDAEELERINALLTKIGAENIE
jgi:hypothetical protein